jgi:hypothetical protein
MSLLATPIESRAPLWTYSGLRDELDLMHRGDSLIIRKDDPILSNVRSIIAELFSSIYTPDYDKTVILFSGYNPESSFFATMLLYHLESF